MRQSIVSPPPPSLLCLERERPRRGERSRDLEAIVRNAPFDPAPNRTPASPPCLCTLPVPRGGFSFLQRSRAFSPSHAAQAVRPKTHSHHPSAFYFCAPVQALHCHVPIPLSLPRKAAQAIAAGRPFARRKPEPTCAGPFGPRTGFGAGDADQEEALLRAKYLSLPTYQYTLCADLGADGGPGSARRPVVEAGSP